MAEGSMARYEKILTYFLKRTPKKRGELDLWSDSESIYKPGDCVKNPKEHLDLVWGIWEESKPSSQQFLHVWENSS